MKRLALVLTISAGLLSGVRASDGSTLRGGGQEGLAAPSFNARPVNGPSTSLKELVKEKGALIALADPNTRTGERLLAFLEQSKGRLEEMKVGLLVFLTGYSQRSSVERYVKNNGLTVLVAHDEGHQLARRLGVAEGALALVVDPDGNVFRRYEPTSDAIDLGPLALGGVRDMLAGLEQAGEGDGENLPEGGTPEAGGEQQGPAAAQISADEALKRMRVGWKLIQTGYVSSALEDARTLVQQRGGDFLSVLWLAYCLEAARLYPEAAVTYREALKLKPGHVYCLQAIARIDPTGRYKTRADLAPPEPPAGDKGQGGEASRAASSEGPGGVID